MPGSVEEVESLRVELERYRRARAVPRFADLDPLLAEANAILGAESSAVRPHDREDVPGGVVHLERNLPTVLLPDIHARPGLLWAALNHPLPAGSSVLETTAAGQIQLVCLGDYFHGEARVRMRWKRAMGEFTEGFRSHGAMDEEMRESLSVLMIITRLKSAFPNRVHLLKGNHENVANESGGGNYPFGKYAYEGQMVFDYLRMVYDERSIARLAEFEKRLPLLAIGRHFLISHAEPARFFSHDEVVDYRHREEVVYGLTWTDNGDSRQGAVREMLDHYLEESAGALYFGGHRPVAEMYHLRADGRYVQIHNPSRYIMALLAPDRPVDLSRDLIDLGAPEDANDAPHA